MTSDGARWPTSARRTHFLTLSGRDSEQLPDRRHGTLFGLLIGTDLGILRLARWLSAAGCRFRCVP